MSRIEGRFMALCVSIQYGESSKENDQLALGMQILDEGVFKGNTVTAYLSFTDKAFPYSVSKLRATGWNGDKLGELIKDGTEDDTHTGKPSFEAKPVSITISYEPWEGKDRMKVNIYDGAGGGTRDPMAADARKAFGARYDKLAAAAGKPAGSVPKPDAPPDVKL